MDGDASGQEGAVAGPKFEIKPIHIIVMVITLLHAVAIAIWMIVFLFGAKGSSLDAILSSLQ